MTHRCLSAKGRVLVFDASDGTSRNVLKSPVGLTTRVLAERGQFYFGGADGNVRCFDADQGRVVWVVGTGHAPVDGQLALGRTTVLVVGADNTLFAIDRASGSVAAQVPLDGVVQNGLRLRGNRLLVQVRRAKTRSQPQRDVLLAFQSDSLGLLWEYSQDGVSPGMAGLDDLLIALPATTGELVLFR